MRSVGPPILEWLGAALVTGLLVTLLVYSRFSLRFVKDVTLGAKLILHPFLTTLLILWELPSLRIERSEYPYRYHITHKKFFVTNTPYLLDSLRVLMSPSSLWGMTSWRVDQFLKIRIWSED